MWQYRRSINSNYYYTYDNNAVVSHLIITTNVAVLPQYNI